MIVTFNKPSTFEAAVAAHRAGRFNEAESIYRQFLAQNPNNFDALHMLGLVSYQRGDPQAGIQLISEALRINPNNAPAWSNLAEVYRQAGRMAEAENASRRGIGLDPNLGPAHVNLAMVLLHTGRVAEALPVAQRGVQLSPNDAAAHNVLGVCLSELQRTHEAIPHLAESVRLNPNDAGAASALGLCYVRVEQPEQAKAAMEHAVKMAPNNPAILLNMGAMYAQMEDWELAAKWIQKTLDISPDYTLALEHMASVTTSLKRFEEAIDMCKRVLKINPQAMDSYATMGEAMMNLGRFEETIEEMRRALTIKEWPTVYQSLSNAYVRTGRPDEGIKYVDKALALDPKNAILHFNKAIILLLMGRYQEAWKEFEWRWQHPRMVGRNRRFSVRQWNGEQLNGKRIFLHAEQGLGDTIFFGRYATLIAEQYGGKVVMWVQTQMKELVRTVPGVVEVIGEGEPIPAFDCHLAIMSLPCVFNTTVETVPNKVPYIKTDPARREHWRQEFARRTNKFKVGLVWEGGPFQPENFLRSNSLAAYAPLADVPGVAFFGLQKGPAEAQCANPPAGMDFTNLGPYIKDFSDTAAILDNLDLLISIDTSVIHVAGALAKPIWMLLAYSPGQMWMFEREDSPWYPTMKIYRQPAFKDWATPVGRVKQDLIKLLESLKK
jgi:tetratricopeptide (TPR) repeat protein